MIAQDITNHPGSIIRIHLDGTIPKDNPKFIDKPDWLPEVYQIGVRNPQGMDLSSFNNKIYISNHGARGGDFLEKSDSVKIMAGKLLDGVELTIVVQRLGMVVHGNQASQTIMDLDSINCSRQYSHL